MRVGALGRKQTPQTGRSPAEIARRLAGEVYGAFVGMDADSPDTLDEAVRVVKRRNKNREDELIYKLPAPEGKEYTLVPLLTKTGIIGLVYGVGAKEHPTI